MNFNSLKLIIVFCVFCSILFLACSNSKNTASTRAFHNLTAHYNVYFNAGESYKSGVDNVEQKLRCDYTEILPVFKIDADGAVDIAKADMETCIQKCGKNILTHSITAKPKKSYGRGGMDESELAFYNKPDFCKWIDDTYLLMGKANYVIGEFDRAESSFRLVTTRFKHEPSKFEATMWLAKTMWAQHNYTDALEQLNKLKADKRHPKKLDREIMMVFADINISLRKYDDATENLLSAIELTKKKSQKAWLTYILGDIYRRNGNYPEAKKCYETVLKMNPDYSTVFNAKINLATVFDSNSDVEKMKLELLNLAKEENNKDYKDQIYYAIAEIERRNNNLDEALNYYLKSARSSTINDVQKSKSYLATANIYFEKPDYINAQQYYDSTMQYLPKSYSDYDEISKKSENLSELTRYINEANYQDSIQRVAKMPKNQQDAIVRQLIAEVAQKEAQQNQPAQYSFSGDNNYGVQYTGQDGNPNFAGKWYLYNTTSLSYGKSEFIKKWGQRRLEDNWRRKNKNVEILETQEEQEVQEEDSTINNKMPEYYLRNLPTTDSAFTISQNIEADSWFAVSDIYREKLNDNDKAIETLLYLNSKNSDHYLMPQSLYALYNLYIEKGEKSLAEYNKLQLISKYPESGYAKILGDPNYLKNVQNRKDSANTMYFDALSYFNLKQYSSCINMCQTGETKYSDLKIAENFYYLEAKSYGRLDNTVAMKNILEKMVKLFPKSSLINPVKDKLEVLNSGKFDYQKFDTLDYTQHYFILVCNMQNENANSINYKLQNFCAENQYFELDITEQNISEQTKIIKIETFANKQTAMEFYRQIIVKLYNDFQPEIDFKPLVINRSNLQLIKTNADIDSYSNFFEKLYR
ncbi:MAG: tetratricopeptide repeat protein [Bacteroidales bacterium]|nr:tetratricopeptide repeat protein [Bacteroidales bacterium]